MNPRSLLLLFAVALPVTAAIPAFPGAEGYGAYATGGRGGDVYYVTTLNNSGAGSLREGLNTVPAGGRTIVFAVSGYIPVVSDTNFNVPSNVTIAGQTAPGDGVGLRGGRMMISGSNSIMRHFRIRHGKNGTGGDCLNIDSTASSTMLDHISMMFSTDENFSFFNSSVNDFTMQYSNSTWGMERHNAGGLWDLQNGSCHHSLWAHHRTRNPKARPGGLLEWINNVTFHWRNEGFIMGDSQTPASWKANVRGCYYIAIDDADDGSTLHSTGLTKAQVASNNVPNFSLFLDNTLFDSNDNGVLDGTNNGYGIVSGSEFTPGDPVGANRYYKSATPFTGATGLATVTVDNPLTGYKKVLSCAAPLRLDANYTGPLRDELDALLNDTVVKQYSILVQKDGKVAGEDPTRTSNGEQLLADQYGITNNGFGTLNGTTPPTDSDLDGMPDAWEITLNSLGGMNFNVAADDHNTVFSVGQLANTFFPTATPTGYTYLEEYLHFLAVPHATVAKNTTAAPSVQVVDLRKYTDGFSAVPTFAVTNALNGTTQQYLANGTTLATNGPIVKFTPTLDAIGRGGFNFTVTDADGSQWTQQFALLISAAAAPRDLLWIGNGSTNVWDNATPNWKNPSSVATTFGVGDTALLDDRGSATPTINLSSTQTAGSVLITGTKNYTLGGSGSIASTGSLTKAGDTTLTLSANTSFAAGTFLNGGTTNLSDSKTLNGGAVRFSGGATLNVNYASGTYFTLNPNVQVDAGATGNINLSQRSELNGSLSGGGTFNLFSPSNLGTEGRVYFDGASAGCTGQVNLSGGATSPGNAGRMAFRANGGSFNGFGNAKVNLSGLDLFTTNNSAGNTYTLGELSGDANSRLRSNYLNGGGATTWSVGSRNTSTTFAGVIMDGTRTDGSNSPTNLTKTGSGTLTLSGANSYAGSTTVSGGTLRVTGSLGASAITVASGAKLSGSAALGGTLTLSGGSTVDPGNAPETVGTMNVTNGLTLSSGSNYLFDLSANPNAGNDQIIVQAGTLSQTGTLNFIFNPIDGYLGSGIYYLITGAPNSSASTVLFTSNFPANTRQTFTIARSSTSAAGAKSIWLTVGGSVGSLVWTGSTSIWDIANATPWTNGPSGDNRFFNLDTVTFNNNATNRTVTLSAALEPTAVIVDNSGEAYTFDGSGNLAGGSVLTKRGTGTLTLSNTTANSHGGGTLIEAGTLTLGNNTAGLGNGIVYLKGGMLTLPNDATYISNSFVVSGSSAISSLYTGNSTILNSTSNTLTSVNNPTLSLAGLNGIMSINGSMSGYSGAISLGSSSGILRLNSNSIGSNDVNFGSADAHFDLGIGSARLTNRNGNITIHVGALSGGPNTHLDGRQSGSGNTTTTYIIGEKNLSTTFSGSISHSNDLSGLAIIKTGSGILTLAGTSTFIGSLAVNQGEIAISGNTTMTGNATLQSGSTLSLAGGTLGVSVLNASGNLSGYGTVAGEMNASGNYTGRGFGSGTPGVLQITGSASFNTGTLKMLGGVVSDRIEAAGDLTVTGVVQIALASGTPFGRYTLAIYGGTLDMAGVSLTGIPSGTSAHLSSSVAGQISLVVDDSDEDGLPDSWEKLYFGNLTSGLNNDPDGDGQSNGVEYLAGTNPKNGASRFTATIVRAEVDQFMLSWPSVPGKQYDIETNPTLSGTWQTLLSNFPAAASPATSTSLSITRNDNQRFYRVVVRP